MNLEMMNGDDTPYSREKEQRNAEWCRLYSDGKSSQEIGDLFGVCRERVCQILRKANLIEHKAQRRRLAAEMIELDRLEVKAAKQKLDEQLIGLVRGGQSIASAAAQTGLTTIHGMNVCKKHGVISLHGRWHDNSKRRDRLTQLIEGGYSVKAALEIAGGEEGRKIGYCWVHRHCSELLAKNRTPKIVSPPRTEVTPSPIVRSAIAAPRFPEIDWTTERVEQLLALWFKGSSAQQIADIFGDCSRNAIIGQVHRLRVAGKLRSPA